MRKMIGAMMAVMLLACVSAQAGMEDREFSATVVGATTSTVTYVLRGTLEAVLVDVTAPATSTVTVASQELTLFTKSGIAADSTYMPRATTHTTAGAAISYYTGNATNWTSMSQYESQPMAGPITVTLVGQNGTSVTNNTKVTLLYRQ
jgi:hypothetical protein